MNPMFIAVTNENVWSQESRQKLGYFHNHTVIPL